MSCFRLIGLCLSAGALLLVCERAGAPCGRARVPCGRHPGGSLSDRPGATTDRPAGDAAGHGRHSIRVFHSRQLGEESQTIAQTRAGAIDINRINVAAIGDTVPVLNVLGAAVPVPIRRPSPQGDRRPHRRGHSGRGRAAWFHRADVLRFRHPFHLHRAPAGALDRRPARTAHPHPAVRPDGEEGASALGAAPIGLPYGQVATALSANLVDGAENNWPSYVSAGHYKVAPFYTVTQHSMAPEIVIMSRRAWDELSPEDRTIFREAARESTRYMRQLWLNFEQQSRKQALEAGVTGHRIDRPQASSRRRRRALRDAMRADPRLGALVGRIEAER